MTKKQGEERKKEQNKIIYIGPTIEGVAIQNVVYNNGMPESAKEAIKEEAVLSALFIPLEQYSKGMAMLTGHKGYAYEAYVKALKYKDKRKGEKL